MSTAWALLIAIDVYSCHPPVGGCLKDAEAMRDYLERVVGVPSHHICLLANEAATRVNILSAIQSHLVDNPSIAFGDSRLLYFAGYGSRTEAPFTWPVVEDDTADGSEKRFIEIILPTDESAFCHKTRKRIPGIAGRPIAGLLRRAAQRHGNKMTVVLDCCYGGDVYKHCSPVSTAWSARGLHPTRVSPLWCDLDEELWMHDQPSSTGILWSGRPYAHVRNGFLEGDFKSHVAMKACDQGEVACGNITGGLFTRFLLGSLLESPKPLSYAELIHAIRRRFLQYRSEGFITQHPLVYGGNQDLPFLGRNDDGLHSVALGHSSGECIIEAGEIHGARPGTVFDIYDLPTSQAVGHVLGIATVTAVYPTHCIARLHGGIKIPATASAVITQWPLRYAISTARGQSSACRETCRKLRSSFGLLFKDNPGFALVCSRTADVIFRIDDQSIVIERHDRRLRRLETCAPRITTRIFSRELACVLVHIARFNFYLARHNPRGPFADEVTLELRRIESNKDDSNATTVPYNARLGKAIPWKNQEAVVPHDPEALYSLVLRNHSATPLYPYVFWFDPATYAIEEFYTPPPWKGPTLRPNRNLELGIAHDTDALAFVVNSPEVVDSGYLKVILAPQPIPALHHVKQGPVFNSEDDKSHSLAEFSDCNDSQVADTEAMQRSLPHMAEWDTITRQVTVQGLGHETIE